jgi:hypothetical protein
MPKKAIDPESRLRKICLSFPQTTERLSHTAPTWYFKDKKSFLMLWPSGHHQNRFPHFWCAAGPGVPEDLIGSDPAHFFRPPYVGGRGWVGARLDRKPDWALIERLCAEAYRTVAGRP